MLRFLWRFVAFLAEMNGYTPFFQALFKANLAIIVGGLSRSEWVGMLRFRHLLKTADIRSPKTGISVHFSYSLPMAMQIY